MWNPPDDEVDYVYDEEAEMEEETVREEPAPRRGRAAQGGNVVPMPSASRDLQVVLFKPENFGEETRAIADELLKRHTAVLNLEDTQKECFPPDYRFPQRRGPTPREEKSSGFPAAPTSSPPTMWTFPVTK